MKKDHLLGPRSFGIFFGVSATSPVGVVSSNSGTTTEVFPDCYNELLNRCYPYDYHNPITYSG
jgi:hypothetical protein